MQSLYVGLIELGLTFLKQFLTALSSNATPITVVDALQAAIVALEAHKTDVMSKADWEAQRG